MSEEKEDNLRQAKPTDAPIAARTQIMRAAEKLFAEKGLHGTALREIALASNAAISLITYHFKTKEDLFRAVTNENAARIMKVRQGLLDSLEARYAPDSPPLSDTLNSMIRPIFLMKEQDPDIWDNYLRIFLREMGSDIWQESMGTNISITMKRYAAVLRRTIKGMSRSDALLAAIFTFMAIRLSSSRDMAVIVGEDLIKDWSDEALEERLTRMLTAAVAALASPPSDPAA